MFDRAYFGYRGYGLRWLGLDGRALWLVLVVQEGCLGVGAYSPPRLSEEVNVNVLWLRLSTLGLLQGAAAPH